MIKCSKINANQRFRVVRSALTYSTFGFLHRWGCRRQLGAFLQWAKAKLPSYSFSPFDRLRRQPLQTFLSSLYSWTLEEQKEETQGFTTLLSSLESQKRSQFRYGSVPFQCWMGGVFIGPNPVQNSSSKRSNPGIPGSGGCTSWLERLHRLAELEDWASGRCHLC